MNSNGYIKISINFLIVLILSQIYINFSLFRFYIILLLVPFSICGVLIGFYLAFQTKESIIPDLNNKNFKKRKSLYQFHTDSLKYNENKQSSLLDNEISADNFIQRKTSKIGSKKQLDNFNFINEFMFNGDNLINDNYMSVSFDLQSNEDNSENEDDEYLDVSGSYKYDSSSLDTAYELSSQLSNSKLDTYLDEIFSLIIRDFVMSWMNKFIWEKEKCFSTAK